ncbi:MAG: NUDIX hydrolase [Neisseriaceae bacterium]|nr:NUDIX hydrolase [Neisseriaceae bacterium]
MIEAETKLNSSTILQGKVLHVCVDEVKLPNGNSATREVVHHPGAVAVLAITNDEKIILVEQYRYACSQTLLEIPAGKLDIQGESPQQCALRELAEETPYTAKSVELIYTFYTSAGFSDEKLYLYQAHDLCKNSTARADEDEFLRLVMMDKKEAADALNNGRILDVKTIVAMQYWLSQ